MGIPNDIFHITSLREIQNDQKFTKFMLQNERYIRTEISTFQSWMENIFRFKMKDIWRKKKSCFCSCSLNNIRKSLCLVKPYVLNLLIHIHRVRRKLHFFYGRHFFFSCLRLERDKGYIWYSKSISRWMEECFFFSFKFLAWHILDCFFFLLLLLQENVCLSSSVFFKYRFLFYL